MARISKASIATQITTNFADNASGDISAADMRDQLDDQNDSYAHLDDTDALNSGKADTSHTHTLSDVTDSGALAALATVGTPEIDNDAVTLVKLANISTGTVLGRVTAATGDPEVLTATQARTVLNVEDGATADQTALEVETLYNTQVALVDLATAQAGVSNVVVRWSPVRVAQLVDARAQPLDDTLTSIAAISTNGLVARDGTGSVEARTLTAPAAGITVANGDGAAGNPTLALANDLGAIEGLGSTGLAARTGADAWAQRSIVGTTDQISATDGDGVSGNPTIAAVVASQAEAEAGTDTTKLMTAQRTSQAIAALAGGASLPVDDTTALVQGSADNTKQVRIEADGLTTSTTRVITMPDEDVDLGEFSRPVTVSAGGTVTLVEATHRNALIKITTASAVTIAAPSSDTGRWVTTVWNDGGADHTVAGQVVSAGSITTIVVDGTTATPFSTSQTKTLSIFIPTGDDAVLYQGAPLSGYGAYTILAVENETISGTITLDVELEDDTDNGNFTSVTSLDAVTVTSTKATDTATAANVSDDGRRQIRITGSSNSSAVGIALSMTVRV